LPRQVSTTSSPDPRVFLEDPGDGVEVSKMLELLGFLEIIFFCKIRILVIGTIISFSRICREYLYILYTPNH
jgi:hypothetical protein